MITQTVLAIVVSCPPIRQKMSDQPTIAREAEQARLNVAKWVTAREQHILTDCFLQRKVD